MGTSLNRVILIENSRAANYPEIGGKINLVNEEYIVFDMIFLFKNYCV